MGCPFQPNYSVEIRERDKGERETDRQTDRQKERERETKPDRESQRGRETQREGETELHSETQGEREGYIMECPFHKDKSLVWDLSFLTRKVAAHSVTMVTLIN